MAYEFTFPDVGEGISEGEIVEWLVKEGDSVKEDQPLVKVETDKAVVELPSPRTGSIARIHFKVGETIKVGQPLVTINEGGEPPIKSEEKPKEKKAAEEKKEQKKAEEVEEETVGVVGKFEKAKEGENVFERAKRKAKVVQDLPEEKKAESVKKPEEPATDLQAVRSEAVKKPEAEKPKKVSVKKKYDIYGMIQRLPYKGVRKSTGKLVSKSYLTAAHVTHTDEADVTELVKLRKKEKVKAEKQGIHLTFLPYIMKACISSLKKHPSLNALLDEEGEEIILKQYYNIGIAVSAKGNLFVPVVKGADQKGLFDIAKEIAELSDKVKKRTIDLGDMKGGTFTITNVGSAGGIFATPIINYPEAAILALGRIRKKPVVMSISGKDEIIVRHILPISVTFDHRILDGAEAALFTNDLIAQLEDPKNLPK